MARGKAGRGQVARLGKRATLRSAPKHLLLDCRHTRQARPGEFAHVLTAFPRRPRPSACCAAMAAARRRCSAAPLPCNWWR